MIISTDFLFLQAICLFVMHRRVPELCMEQFVVMPLQKNSSLCDFFICTHYLFSYCDTVIKLLKSVYC